MATYCRHPYIHLRARSYVSLRSGGSILLSKAGPFLASGEDRYVVQAVQKGRTLLREVQHMLLLKTVRSLRLIPCSTLLLALLLVFLAASPLPAQVESGKVLGEVQDSTGAMVKGAKAYDTPSSHIVLATSRDGIHLKEKKILGRTLDCRLM